MSQVRNLHSGSNRVEVEDLDFAICETGTSLSTELLLMQHGRLISQRFKPSHQCSHPW